MVWYFCEFWFCGDIDGYVEGELYFFGLLVFLVCGSFVECVLFEMLVLLIFNYDIVIVLVVVCMVSVVGGCLLIEMGLWCIYECVVVVVVWVVYIVGFVVLFNLVV